MLLGLLAGVVVYSLAAGSLPHWAALTLSAAAVVCLRGGHAHGGVLRMDVYARRSGFSGWNPGLKTAGSVALLLLCVVSDHVILPLSMSVVLAALTVGKGKLSLRIYVNLLRLPAAFLLLSALALLWDVSAAPVGTLNLPLFHGFLVVTPAAQQAAALVLARALGAVSCLYFLSLSTPVPELLQALRRLRLPEVVLDLMVLMYRYIFLLLCVHADMKNAAASRLGYGGLGRSLRTTGAVYGNLLAGSFRKAGACYDAMESRCYSGGIAFLEVEKPVTAPEVALFAVLIIAGGALCILS